MPERAQELPQLVHVRSVSGGQNDTAQPWLIGESQAVELLNFDLQSPGARKRRLGVVDQGGRTGAPFGACAAVDSGQGRTALFASYANQLFMLPGAGVVSQRCCSASLTSHLHQFVEGRYGGRSAIYVVSNGVHETAPSLASRLLVFTDNDTTTQAASFAPRAATWFQSRLWIVDNVFNQDEETLWWSELNDGTLYSSTNTIRPWPGIGGRCTAVLGIRSSTPSLLVFKQRATVVLEPHWGASSSLIPAAADALDTVKSAVRLISLRYGCVAARSIQHVPGRKGGDILFLADDGVRSITRSYNDDIAGVGDTITDSIRTTIQRINFSYAHKIVSAVVGRRYLLAVPLDGATDNTHILALELDNDSPEWNVFDWTAKDLVTALANGETQERLWMQYNASTGECSVTGLQASYHVFKNFSGQADPGTAGIVYRETTRAFDFGDVTVKKRWDAVYLTVKNDSLATATIGVRYSVNGLNYITAASCQFGGSPELTYLGTTPLPWGSQTGAIRVFRFSLADAQPSYTIQFKLQGESDSAIPALLDVCVAARPLPFTDYDNSIS